ncbi:MAG: hypothetical protein KJZ69_18680 [Phycisphaerales bacterium]|nr:hypothetical protein [Phycisphaerales bacterium]
MSAPRNDIPIIDLFTGLPWIAEPVSEPCADATAAAEPTGSGRSSRVRRTADAAGPPIAPHRFVDATAVDRADAREEQRRGCKGCRQRRESA